MTLTADQIAEQMAVELTRACPAALGHLWQATVFGILVGGLAITLRRAPARVRHGLYLLASLKFLIPSVLLLALLGRFYSQLADHFPPWLASALQPREIFAFLAGWLPTNGPLEAAQVPSGGWIWSLLVVVWLVGVAALTSLWGRRLAAFRAVLRRGSLAPAGVLTQQLDAVRQRLNIRRPIALVLSDEVTEPGVWGVRRPTVVVPASMPGELSAEELEVVFLHELVHVHRRDNLISHLHMSLCCLFWFHPLVWWIDRRLLVERERACDDRVVELSGASEVYARSLVKVLRLGLGWRLAGVSGAGGADLKGRLEHIRRGAPAGVSLWHRGAVVSALGLLFLMSLAAVPFSPRPEAGGEPIFAMTIQESMERAERGEGDEIGACDLPEEPPALPDGTRGAGGSLSSGGVRTAI
jgi:bla regulator protein blaR1